jgi:amino acid adenylation domain-containing protein
MNLVSWLIALGERSIELRRTSDGLAVARGLAQLDAEERSRLSAAKADLLSLFDALQLQSSWQLAPMSAQQRQLWTLQQLDPEDTRYHEAVAFRLRGPLQRERLAAALRGLVERHAILRSVYREIEGEAVQLARPQTELDLRWSDSPTSWSEATLPAPLRSAVDAFVAEPFRLEQCPPLRVAVWRLAEQDHLLCINTHHIASDRWSLNVLLRELAKAYAGPDAALPAPSLQYADYALHQRKYLDGAEAQRDLSFWTEQLQDAPPVHNLPLDRPRQAGEKPRADQLCLRLSPQAADDLRALARSEQASLFMLLQSVFALLLARLGNERDVVMGTVVANRERLELAELVGHFVNTVVLRTEVDPALSVRQLLRAARARALAAFEHQRMPFERVVEAVNPVRSANYQPLYQIMFAVHNDPAETLRLDRLQVEAVELEAPFAKFELALDATPDADGLQLRWEYNRALFEPATVAMFARSYHVLLASAVAQPDVPIAELAWLADDDVRRLLATESADAAPTRPPLAHEAVRAQAERFPDRIALRDGARSLSYRELQAQVEKIAHALRARGADRERLIAVALPRGIEQVVAMLGIWRSGAAYLPLDPSHPAGRLTRILADAEPLLLVTNAATPSPGLEYAGTCVTVDQLMTHEAGAAGDVATVEPADLAYVIYTSGSTGTPKGVAVEHRHLAIKLLEAGDALGIGAEDVFPNLASSAFDISLLEVLLPLTRGGVSICVPAERVRQLDELHRASAGATVFHAVPSLMSAWLEYLEAHGVPAQMYPALRCLLVGGDAVPPRLLADLHRAFPQAEVVELYGPTEATIISTCHRYAGPASAAGTHCIGRRLAYAATYVLDAAGRPLPDGVAGELYLGGAAVARGYYRREALSAERFLPDSFSAVPNARMYRTGDLVRRAPNGNLLFLGRNDQQVKLRGFRIELGEIEHALLAQPDFAAALVMLREDPGQPKALAAYYTMQPGCEAPDEAALQAALAATLPPYMVPSFFVPLERMPLNANGKIDRNALPAPGLPATRSRRAPSTALEQALHEVWCELLGIQECGVDDNFFALGGHSLLAARLATVVARRLQRPVPMKVVFEAQTIAELAARLATPDEAGIVALPVAEAAESYPLSPVQKRIWLAEQLQPGSAVYHIPAWFRLSGALDAERLRRALQAVYERHDILYAAYREVHGEPRMFPAGAAAPIEWSTSEWRLAEAGAPLPPQLRDEARAFGARPFDLEAGRVLRARLIRLSEHDHLLLLVLHHIAVDGIALTHVMAETGAAYDGNSPSAERGSLRYVDYAVWSNSPHAHGEQRSALEHRAARLHDLPTVHNLPLDRPRPPEPSARGGLLHRQISASTWRAVQTLAATSGATPFMVLHAALAAFVHRHGGDTDVAIGVPAANRALPGCAELVGCLVNTVVLRSAPRGDASFAALLAQSRDEVRDAFVHQALPFDALVERVAPARSNAHHPLFQIMLAYQPGAPRTQWTSGVALAAVAPDYDSAKFDLTLYAAEHDQGLQLTWEYARDLFDAATIEAFAQHFESLLHAGAANPRTPLAALPMLGQAERQQLLDWNDTATAYPERVCIHELIEAQVRRTPAAPALTYLGQTLSYAELNARANRLAHALRARGVGPDVLVGLCLERSIEMVVAILATVKAGGAYVPLAPENPPARLAQMLAEGGIETVLCQARFRALLPDAANVLALDDVGFAQALERQADTDLPVAALGLDPDRLAYVIFTSGSTGQPKGVMVPHRGLVNRIDWMQRTYRLDARDVVLQKTPYGFDVSVWEFFWPLLAGARLVVAKPDGHRDPEYLCGLIREEAVTTLHFVPSMLRVMLEQEARAFGGCTSLRQVFASGEALAKDLVERFFASGCAAALHNLYGPTEASIDVSHWTCERDATRASVPIGRPIQNIGLHVLDAEQRLAPIGVAGELCIAGVGLARGYLNRADLTAERFLEVELSPGRRERVYRTGDLARWTREGVIEYLGRLDHQVKIRGLRIELGEIEAALLALDDVDDAVVVADADVHREPQLVAYVVTAAGLDVEAVSARLRRQLPDYMVPARFMQLPALPLSSNGKVDRKRLPKPEAVATAAYVPPRSATELALAELWCETLGATRVGAGDNFFHLGGHSLLAMRLVAAIRRRWSIAFGIKAVFEHQRLASLAAAIDAALPASGTEAPPAAADATGAYPLSFAQQRLWLQEQLEPGSVRNVMAGCLELRGELDAAALARALDGLRARHEILRTRYEAVAGQPRQRILAAHPNELPLHDLSSLSEAQRESRIAALARANGRAFDLERETALRADLLRLAPDRHLLLLALHHIASDGWSNGVLRNELSALYRSALHEAEPDLPALPLRYVDYASWQRAPAQADALAADVDYWTRSLRDAPQVHGLPLDRARGATPDPAGDVLEQELPPSLAEALRAAARRHEVTLFTLLHATFSLLVGRYSGASDVVVGTTLANRAAAGVEGVVGLFMNPVALRTDLSGLPSFAELMRRAHANVLAALEHQAAPFDMVLNALGVERTVAHAPLIQLMLILQNNDAGQWRLPGLAVYERASEHTQARLDLIVDAVEHAQGLSLRWEFSKALFDRDSVERMAANFRRLLEAALADPECPVARLPMLSDAESARLAAWNPAPLSIAADAVLVHELFALEAARSPQAVAVIDGERRLGYGELEARANLLARVLLQRGAGRGRRVAVLMPRSLESVVAFLGVLKAGAVYVPIDPEQPEARIRSILAQAEPACVLVDRADTAPAFDVLALADLYTQARLYDAPARQDTGVHANALAYTIFTSGSTGEPKGVEVEHAAILSSYRAWEELYELKSGTDRHLQMAGIAFDVCIGDLVRALCSGGTLVICPKDTLLDAPALHGLIAAHEIQFAEFVPIALRNLIRHLEETGARLATLRFLVAGSDIWHCADLARARAVVASHTRIANSYGLTEAAVDSTCFLPDAATSLPSAGIAPIGRPLRHATVHVVDGGDQRCPIGVAGELLVGGPGLARGYLNQPALTAQRFVANPFGGGRLYRTGDLARWRADGELEILGRIDHQVKIRGFRVELGEIEARLKAHPAVLEAVVVDVLRDPGNRQLAAYVSPRGARHPQVEELRLHLSQGLPDYMVPAAILVLPALPTNANGKIDRRALPAPTWQSAGSRAPGNAIEALLVECWRDLLNLDQVGVDANFFHLGGHSLLASRLVAFVADRFQARIGLRTVFETPTIEGLARRIAQATPVAMQAIPHAGRDRDLPLSSAQRRLWLVDQLEPGSAQYNIALALRIRGELSPSALQQALSAVAARHEILRTTYLERDGEVRQRIMPAREIPLPCIDLSGLPTRQREAELERHAATEAATPFDLTQDTMLRAVLVKLGAREHVVLFTLHHIAADGWSMGVLTEELTRAYRAAIDPAHAEAVPPLPIQYGDYAAWQAGNQAAPSAATVDFWRQRLADAPATHQLPLDRPRPARQSHRGATHRRVLDARASARVRDFARERGVTLFTVLHTALAAVLARSSLAEDVVIGAPIANRDRSELASLVGFFANTVVLRTSFGDDPSFAEVLRSHHDHLLDAVETHPIAFEQLVEQLQVERSLRHHPVFQVLLVLQNNRIDAVRLDDLQVEVFRPQAAVAKFDLTLDVSEQPEALELNWEYATDLFDAVSIERLADRFVGLLESALATPELPVSRLPWLSEAALAEVEALAAPAPPADAPRLVHEWAATHPPRAAALRQGERSLDYGQLNRAANRLAQRLVAAGVAPDTVVAIVLPRSIELVVAVLAVLRSGAAYVGIDPEEPAERRDHMLRDAQVRIALADDAFAPALAPLQTMPVDVTQLDAATESDTAPHLEPSHAERLAYLIYTSGTTGGPKAVLQRHRTLMHLVEAQRRLPGGEPVLDSALATLQYAALAFDVSIQEMATAWRTGSELVMIDKQERMDPERVLDLVQAHGIGRLFLPPAMLAPLAESALARTPSSSCLREVVVAGDALRIHPAIEAWQARAGFTLVNHYGPSETHVVTHHRVSAQDGALPPIGRALAGHGLRVLDRHGRLQARGVPGELVVHGPGVALGYLHRPELTAERFVDGGYRTGDLVRWRNDDTLEFLGRIDQQVKIRGYRVELEEIASALCAHAAVADAAVLVRPDRTQQNQLVAYLVAQPGAELPDYDAWRAFLRHRLPDHMLPAACVAIAALPLTRNGKLDRARLPEPEWRRRDDAAPPRTATEAALVRLWGELLGQPHLGVHDNFFHVGGHSLLAVQLVSRIQRQLGKSLGLRTLLEAPTIAELAACLDRADALVPLVGPLRLAPEAAHEPFPLTDVQQAYWLGRSGEFDLGNIGTHSYIEIPARALDVARLERAWNLLIERHAMLRMVLTDAGDQRILASVPAYRIARHHGEGARLALRARMSHQVFSGREWPLFELAVTELSGEDSVLHVSIDALALDASSAIQLGQELTALYLDPERVLPALSISFRDYVLSEQALRDSPLVARSREYWHGRLADFPAAPELPLAVDPATIAQPHFSGQSFKMPAAEWERFKRLASQHSVTPTTAVIGAFATVLERFGKQPRFALNLTLFNRIEFHEQVDRLVGDFTSLTLLEIDHREALPFRERLARLQRRLWEDLEHKYYTGIEVQRELSRREQRALNFPVVVTSTLGLNSDGDGSGPFSRDEIYTVSQTPQVWLDFQLSEMEGQLACNWDSVVGLFRPGVVESMFEVFTRLLTSLAQDESLWNATALDSVPARTWSVLAQANGRQADLVGALEHLHAPLLAQCAARPQAIAVHSADRVLTYGELERASAHLAARLAGVPTNSLVAVVMPKHWAQIVAVLGILRAGAAYLPIDAGLPPARIAELLRLGEVERIVSLPEVAAALALEAEVITPDWLTEPVIAVPPSPACATDLAYVIFTSGSTGTPKGVMIDHRGALNTVLDINARYGIGADAAVFGLSSLSFDLSVYDVFGVLGAGGRLVLPAADDSRDPEAWLAQLVATGTTVWNTVPALLQMLVDYLDGLEAPALPPLQAILLSGDWIPVELPARVRRWFPQARLYSLGGATEASIWSIDHPIGELDPQASSVPYGRALTNQQVMALKPDFTPCPVWVPGELHLGGIGLAQGYWRDPVRTAERFVTDPASGKRWYRTGDYGRLLPDGSLEFLGREDAQVKIQGYRIELGEIEARLKQHPQVKDAVVVAQPHGRGKQLVAFVVPKADWNADAERQAFIAAQTACRRDLDACPALSFGQAPDSIELRRDSPAFGPVSAAPLQLQQLARLLAPLSAQRYAELPLPKRYYASAGGLYPVQAYVLVSEGQVEGVEAGAYYYDPLAHRLLRIGAAPAAFAARNRLLLVTDLEAIEPLYGSSAFDFSRIEAGYIEALLRAAAPDGLGLAAQAASYDPGALRDSLKLGASHRLLAAYEVNAHAEPSTERDRMPRLARKSYRRFASDTLRDDHWQAFAEILAQTLRGTPIRAYGWRRGHAHAWCLDDRDAQWHSLSAPCASDALFPSAVEIATQAGFAIVLAAADADQAMAAGQAVQAVANRAIGLGLGLCAIGETDAEAAARSFELAAGHKVLHAVLGGEVGLAQMQAIEVSTAPTADLQASMKAHVGRALPAYMVPSHVVALAEIPLSTNGKVDRKALPMPSGESSARAASGAAATPAQAALCAIWREALGLGDVGIDDSFFACGGDSIRAIVVLTRARKLGIDFSVRELYAQQTIRALCGVARIDAEKLARGAQHDESSQRPAAFALLDPAVRRSLVEEGIADAYPMTWLQQGLVFHNLLDGERGTYHDIVGTRIAMAFEPDAFRAALAGVIARHPILRTVLRHDFNPPLQLVLAELEPPLLVEDLRALPPERQRERVRAWMESEKSRPFEPSLPPWQVVIHRGDDGFHYSLVCHHALLDGWSVAQFNTQLFDAYQALLRGEAVESAPGLPFSCFVAEELRAARSEAAREYWRQELQDAPLPWWTGANGVRNGGRPHRHTWTLDAAASAAVERLAKQLGIAERTVFLGVNLVLLGLLTGRNEALTSVVANGRPMLEGADTALGLFLNTLPLRAAVGARRWSELLVECERKLQAMQPHQGYPLALIQEATDLDFSGALFTYVNLHAYADASAPSADGEDHGFDLTNYRFAFEIAKNEGARRYRISLTADDAVFDAAFAARMAVYCRRALAQLLAAPENPVAYRGLLEEGERERLLGAWNRTAHPVPEWRCWHELFEAQAARTPDAVAVLAEERFLSYASLNARANALAHYLRAQGVRAGDRVGLLLERGLDMVVAIYGVMKAGAAYVPLDPGHPSARLRELAEDAGLQLVLTHSDSSARIEAATAVALDRFDYEAWPSQNLPIADTGVDASHPAYVIYTSGSTGKPKGVLVPHRGLVNRILWMDAAYALTPADVVLQKTPYGFDVSVWEFTWPLLVGARLVMARPEGHKDPAYLARLIEQAGVTTLHFVPSMLRLMLEQIDFGALSSVRQVFCSGEALTREVVANFHASGSASRLHNLYGPTEASIDVSHWTCEPGETRAAVPIGHPIWNTALHVLDERGEPAPLGVPGELHIAGMGLALGYLNRPELTAERFVPNPFDPDPRARMYRTGDLVRRAEDGALEFLGRIDHQVKVRGFRIELGEIEAALRTCAGVNDAVVVAPNNERLVAYLESALPESAQAAWIGELRAQLRARLPEYMVPAQFVILARLPLNASGKIDRKALPAPAPAVQQLDGSAAPRTRTEIALARIWQRLLRLEQVGAEASFFEVGGDSLSLVRLAAEIKREWRKEIPVMQIYRATSVREQARLIDADRIEPVPILQCLTPARTRAELSLLAVPYAAGDGLIYHDLAKALDERIAVHAVDNPRDFDPEGDLDAQMEAYIGALVAAVREGIDTPLVIWGHCVGYALALTLARRLIAAGAPVRALCVGGVVIDADHVAQTRSIGKRAEPPAPDAIVALLTQAGLGAAHALAAEDWQNIAEKFRQDSVLSVWCNHEYFGQAPAVQIEVPLYCFVAADDPLTQDAEASAGHWSLVSPQVHTVVLRDGGHYFVKTRSAQVAAHLAHLLAPRRDAMACPETIE